MFEPGSRYFDLETTSLTLPGGREVRYGRRRFLPPPAAGEVFTEHPVAEGERLDHITARYLGDPELFWRLCDINNAMQPDELTAEIGRKLRVALLLV
jgi:hypothetical protein